MIQLKLCHLIAIVLWIQTATIPSSEGGFLLPKKSSLLGRLYKKITSQPKYCLSFCSCGSANEMNHQAAGVQLEPNEYPWLALIYNPSDLTTTYPGTLINDKYIVSSAYNFYGKAPFQLKVKLGYHFNCQYEKTSITFSVSEIIIHPLYVHNDDHLGNDIALLKLSNAVHFNHEISPICLPSKGLDYNGHVGSISSWSVAPKSPFELPTINCSPRKYQLPITSGFHCTDKMAPESESCIGVFGSTSLLCRGDGGAGIFNRRNKQRFDLIGILSHRQSCGDYSFDDPLVIKDQLAQNGTMASANSTTTIVEDLKMMKKGRQLHSLQQSDPLAQAASGDHYYEPLPVYTNFAYHLDWIVENTKDSCFCKPKLYFSLRFNKFH